MNKEKALTQMGRFYERVHKLPFLGDRLVRRMARGIGFLTFHTPLMGFKAHDSIQGVRQDMEKLAEMNNGGHFEIIRQDETSFEYLSSPCPWGFRRKDQQGVCDAAMDMNRRLFDMCGAEITIHESCSSGAPQCRISVRMKS